MVSVVQYLTNRIEDSFSLRDGNDNYLLHYACRGGNIEVVRYLLESGHTRAVSEKKGGVKEMILSTLRVFGISFWLAMQ